MQKMTATRPIYLNGEVVVEGAQFETTEQHARELTDRGYAVPHGRTHRVDPQAGEPLTEQEAAKEKRLAETEVPARRRK